MKFKTLNEWLSYLESIHPAEIDLGLERVARVAQAMDLVRPANKVLVVAGTNGKGSTVSYCDAILRENGLTVGCYISPHLHVYNERVLINGEMVSDEDIVESFHAIETARGQVTLTYFEFGTLSALYLFKKYGVDVAVLEVGLGGRLDAVNLVESDGAAVTSIGLDHVDWLGDDISVIAKEKAGVFRSCCPAVCGQVDVPATLVDYAHSIGANLMLKGVEFGVEQVEGRLNWFGLSAGERRKVDDLPMPSLPLENLPTALQLVLSVWPDITDDVIRAGVEKAHIAGRMQRFDQPYAGMVDVGHNPQAAALLASQLPEVKGKKIALLAMLADKDPDGVVSELCSQVDEWWLCGLDGYRGQSVDELRSKITADVARVKMFESVEAGLKHGLEVASDQDFVIVLGSFITVAKAQNWLKGY